MKILALWLCALMLLAGLATAAEPTKQEQYAHALEQAKIWWWKSVTWKSFSADQVRDYWLREAGRLWMELAVSR